MVRLQAIVLPFSLVWVREVCILLFSLVRMCAAVSALTFSYYSAEGWVFLTLSSAYKILVEGMYSWYSWVHSGLALSAFYFTEFSHSSVWLYVCNVILVRDGFVKSPYSIDICFFASYLCLCFCCWFSLAETEKTALSSMWIIHLSAIFLFLLLMKARWTGRSVNSLHLFYRVIYVETIIA